MPIVMRRWRCFNPHPALLPGDAPDTFSLRHLSDCFNPHPALLPGDAPRLQPLLDHGYFARIART
jgi:hypothetical protein